MKERPILFSAPMVRALIDGRKTVTRRIVKERPGHRIDVTRNSIPVYVTGAPDDGGEPIRCPYGVPEDRLWVKETYAFSKAFDRTKPREVPGIQGDRGTVWWAADGAEEESWINRGRWRPSIHMPRWASRTTLEIVDVRVERLQDITEEDARAEGVTPFRKDPEGDCWTDGTYRTAFEFLWNEINGWNPNSWESNPWVWRIEFRRLPSASEDR